MTWADLRAENKTQAKVIARQGQQLIEKEIEIEKLKAKVQMLKQRLEKK